jgi:hypothetical protein
VNPNPELAEEMTKLLLEGGANPNLCTIPVRARLRTRGARRADGRVGSKRRW